MASRNVYGKGFGRGYDKGVAETTQKLKAEKNDASFFTGVFGFVVGAIVAALLKDK